jgi:putative ABC transport system permease protein
MIRHVFKLIWNRKKRHFLLITEVFFSFLVLFYVGSMGLTALLKYSRPLGFSYENVRILNLGWRGTFHQAPEKETKALLEQIELELQSHEEIVDFSWVNGCVPYSSSVWAITFDTDGRELEANLTYADDRFADVMGIPLAEGRWYAPEDNAATIPPIVINQYFRKQLVGDSAVLGYRLVDDDNEYQVVGVVDNYRFRGEFENHEGMLFQRYDPMDTAANMPQQAVLKVREGTDVRFEERLLKRLSSIAKDWNLRIETMSDMRSSNIRDMLLQLGTVALVAGFLVFNVALGLCGVFWYSINRRRSEIGLRRALGADRKGVSRQILAEALALASLAMVAGLFVAVQVPILSPEPWISGYAYGLGTIGAVLAIYLIVFLSAWYPSRLAVRIEPAQALHEE